MCEYSTIWDNQPGKEPTNANPLSDEPYGLPSFNLSHDFFASYAFSSFNPVMTVIWGDKAATNIGCVATTVTPDLGHLAQLLRFMPLMVLALTGAAVVFAAIYSPWGSTNVFHWTSNYGRDADLLRLVTPGFGDCLQYIQFVVLTGGLSLNYPGFYQPMVSRASWAALMFNQTLVTDAEPWQAVVDGIYVTKGRHGMARLAELVGMSDAADIWAGMMVWLCVILLAVTLLAQAGFLVQWLLRFLSSTPEEDLRAKNLPFSIGNVIRVVYNYFLLPVISLSAFQLVVAESSPSYTVALAVVTIVLLLGFTAWSLWFIITTRPKSVLFDDLPIVLRYGPLYNTYEDHSAAFALIPVVLTLVRGIAIGAMQNSGISQVILLAICEIIQTLTIHAFRPFGRPTSMNAYHTVFSVLRFVSLMLMVTFASSLGVGEGAKGWIGYAILLLHAIVLILGFFINALQTIVEVVALMLGAGGDDDRGLTRGGLSKIFGMRQLSRRVTPRTGPSRASQLSTAAMLDMDDAGVTGTATSKTGGYSIMPGGSVVDSRLRSSSGASLGPGAILMGPAGAVPHSRTGSGLDSPDLYPSPMAHRQLDSASSYAPGTPGGTSTFSFPISAVTPRAAGTNPPTVPEAADPYYRPPRRRRDTLGASGQLDDQGQGTEGDASTAVTTAAATAGASTPADAKRLSTRSAGAAGDDSPGDISRAATPAPPGGGGGDNFLPNRPDYSTREVDFYYGVRGPALNSDGPGRKLGTGPADPTGPVATASGWFRSIFGGKTKEKGKGFEVVRSARMPPDMARNGGFGDETPPEGIPVAMGVLRNGPIESDDDEPSAAKTRRRLSSAHGHSRSRSRSNPLARSRSRSNASNNPAEDGLLTDLGEPNNDDEHHEPISPLSQHPDDDAEPVSPDIPIPRKSSKRHSALMEVPSHTHTLPFQRGGGSQRSQNPSSREDEDDFDFGLSREPGSARSGASDRPVSYGVVSHRNPARVDPEDGGITESSAEVVRR